MASAASASGGQFPRHPDRPKGQRDDLRLRRAQDPPAGEESGRGREADPRNHGFGTRRLPLETFYYEVYNQDNVELVDIKETPIERITPEGIKTSEREYEFDIIIYATGFDAITGSFDKIDFAGRRRAAEGQMEERAGDLSRHHGP